MNISNPAPAFNQEQTALLDNALGYASRYDWSLIPVNGKKPVGQWKRFQARPADEKTLRRLFAKEGITGLGVILGKVSSMLGCRDFDTEEAYQQWSHRNAPLAKTLPTVRTGRGFHIYFTAPREAYKVLGDGEYRADHKHYCVLPPSWHADAKCRYQWLIKPGRHLPTVDPWEDELIRPIQSTTLTKPPKTEGEVDTTRHNNTHTNCMSSIVSCVHNTEEPNDPVDRAIRATLPCGPGQRNGAIFEFVRRIKALPEYREANLPSLIPLIERWHHQALPFIGTKDFETTLKDFANAYKACKNPLGGCFVEAVFEEMVRSPLPQVAKLFPTEGLRLLVGLCAALQRYNGAKPFILGCRTAARLLGVSYQHANLWIRTLEAFEIIQRTKIGNMDERKASEFRFVAKE